MDKNGFSLFKKMVIIYGLIFTICLALITVILTTMNYFNNKNSLLSLSKEIVNARTQGMGDWIGGFILESKIIASNSVVKTGDKNLIKDELNNIVKSFDKNNEAPAFMDLNGDFITGDGLKGNAADRQYFKEVVNNKKDYYVSNPVISKTSNELIFPIAYKVLDKKNNMIGIFMEPIRLNFLNEVVSKIKMGKNSYAWIIDGKGTVIAHPNKDFINKLNVLKTNDLGYKGLEETGQEMIAQKSGVRMISKKDGSTYYVVYAPIPNTPGWSIGNMLATSDLLESVYASLRAAVIISFILLVLVLILTFLIAKGIVTPVRFIARITKELSIGNIELKGIEENAKEKLIRRNDELGETAKAMEGLINYIKEKEEIAKQMATGDFNVKPKIASETDNFGSAYNKLVVSLNNSIFNIIKASEQVNSGSNQVASASQSLSQGATEQASSLEEITSSITEINSQAKQNSENALQASSLAKKAMENSEAGNKQMKELVTSMANITKSADMIKKIVKVIDDIAFQTNLLALNANVEAARAGKYGKGFAVVAEEVRNLAGRSAESVKETTAMVEEAVKNIMNGNNLVDVTAKQLDEIANSANKVADLVEEIATASKEQTHGLEQINQGLGQIDQVTQANTANAEESASAAEELSSQAQELKTMVAKFKLSEEFEVERIGDSTARIEKRLLNSQTKTIRKDTDSINTGKKYIENNNKITNPKNIIKLDDDDFGKF